MCYTLENSQLDLEKDQVCMDPASGPSLGEILLLEEINLEKHQHSGINCWLTQVSAAHTPEIDIYQQQHLCE